VCRVQYNGRPSAIFRPSDAADWSIQPMVGHLCRSIVFAAVILYCWSIIAISYLSLSKLFNCYWNLHFVEAPTQCTCVRWSTAPCVYPNYRLRVAVNVVKKQSLQWLHQKCFPGEVTEWRRDIRHKTTLSCSDCVECAGWRSESGMKGNGLHVQQVSIQVKL